MIIDKVLYRTNEKLKNPFFSKFGDVLIPGSDTTPNGLARATSIEKDDVLIGGDVNIIRPRKSIIWKLSFTLLKFLQKQTYSNNKRKYC
ncbi:Uncharacterised protein [Mycoplasmoides gallisepticum]|uniref:Uncharacterized protein n=2 Tax=Mycoplasmoides gallisepticum TaxID=2096 RepID=A0A3B0Q3Z2_MYCGL|nr:Uncharacterised protein [Mycoplasmoides gallisepticum]